jgi:hypothetical protein
MQRSAGSRSAGGPSLEAHASFRYRHHPSARPDSIDIAYGAFHKPKVCV